MDEETVGVSWVMGYERVECGDSPGDLVKRVEDEGVPPHSDGDRIITKCKTVGTDEETFRIREDPDAEQQEEVDEVAEIREEIVQAAALVREEADRHEVEKLERIPDMEQLWAPTDEVAADKDIEDTEYE